MSDDIADILIKNMNKLYIVDDYDEGMPYLPERICFVEYTRKQQNERTNDSFFSTFKRTRQQNQNSSVNQDSFTIIQGALYRKPAKNQRNRPINCAHQRRLDVLGSKSYIACRLAVISDIRKCTQRYQKIYFFSIKNVPCTQKFKILQNLPQEEQLTHLNLRSYISTAWNLINNHKRNFVS